MDINWNKKSEQLNHYTVYSQTSLIRTTQEQSEVYVLERCPYLLLERCPYVEVRLYMKKHFSTWSSSLSSSSLLFLWRNTALDSSLNFCNKTSSSEGSWRVEEKKILQCWSLLYNLPNAHLWTLLHVAACGDQIKICTLRKETQKGYKIMYRQQVLFWSKKRRLLSSRQYANECSTCANVAKV